MREDNMYKGKKIISIIPARAGSKRLPGKNLKLLAGKPLIAHSIEQSLSSKYIDATYVSSEDDEILNIAKKFGAQAIKRPDEFASDTAKTISVLKHAVSCLNDLKDSDIIVLLQPTSPLRTVEEIDKAIEKCIDTTADGVITVTKQKLHPRWSLEKTGDESVHFMLENDFSIIRAQDQKETFEINGAVYVYTKKTLMNSEKYVWGEKMHALIMPNTTSIDIDTLEDFEIANAILNNDKKEKSKADHSNIKTITIQDKTLGYGKPIFVIAEA